MDNSLRSLVLINAEKIMQPVKWRIPEDFLTYEHFKRCVLDLEWTSSPGYPYCLTHPTNSIMFGVDEKGKPSEAAICCAWVQVQQRLIDRDSDPVRLFIKPEPHTEKKLAVGRYRLISSVSVIDQLIDAMLFGEMNHLIIKKNFYTPVKAGWVPYVGGWKAVPAGRMVSSDNSAWDWTVQPWLLEVELELRQRLCENVNNLWKDLSQWRYRKLFEDNIFITSGGLLLKQLQPGVMKSGCYNTIATNSMMQLLLHLRVAIETDSEIEEMWIMGDDVMLTPQQVKYFDLLSQFCILKQVDDATEFAGMRFYGYRVEPQYHGKHCFNLLHQDEQWHSQMAASYALLYHRSKHRGLMRHILKEIADIPSVDFIDQIWDRNL